MLRTWRSRLGSGITLSVVILAGGMLLACARPSEQEEHTGEVAAEIRVIASEWKYEPAQIEIPAGKPVRIILENKGSVLHNIAIKEIGFQFDAGVGRSGQKVINVKKAGQYRIICSLPGHAESGMVGSLTVVEGTPATSQ